MALLNVLPADEYPLATAEVPSMLEMISGLIDKGFAYAVDGDVYFRVGTFEDVRQALASHAGRDDGGSTRRAQ